jgi:hypothetical protein
MSDKELLHSAIMSPIWHKYSVPEEKRQLTAANLEEFLGTHHGFLNLVELIRVKRVYSEVYKHGRM